jgi:hypothetical protein
MESNSERDSIFFHQSKADLLTAYFFAPESTGSSKIMFRVKKILYEDA